MGEEVAGFPTAADVWMICSLNGLVIDDEQMDLLVRYAEDLLYWNEKVNLISRKDVEHIWIRHILHALAPVIAGHIPSSGRMIDVGTGGGIPGIPMKIVRPDLDVLLVDSIAKKVRTTGMLASHITKHGLRAMRTRVEELVDDPKHRAGYDVVTARAVAPIGRLLDWTRGLLKPGGSFVFLKGGDLVSEIADATRRHPDVTIEVEPIVLKGTDWFASQDKRIVIARPDAAAS